MNPFRKNLTLLLSITIFLPLNSSCKMRQGELIIFAAASLTKEMFEMIGDFSELSQDIAASFASSTALWIPSEGGAAVEKCGFVFTDIKNIWGFC